MPALHYPAAVQSEINTLADDVIKFRGLAIERMELAFRAGDASPPDINDSLDKAARAIEGYSKKVEEVLGKASGAIDAHGGLIGSLSDALLRAL